MSFMETRSGKKFEFEDTDPDSIVIEDIAEHLSKICRFNGACRGFYSVAEHSVLLSQCVPKELQLHALLHDATEAYIGDVIRPVKIRYTSLKEYEGLLMPIIFEALGQKYDHMQMEILKHADNRLLITEKRQIMADNHSYEEEADYPDTFQIKIQGLNWENARQLFMDRWKELTDGN